MNSVDGLVIMYVGQFLFFVLLLLMWLVRVVVVVLDVCLFFSLGGMFIVYVFAFVLGVMLCCQ